MDVKEVLRALGEPEAEEAVAPDWAESGDVMPVGLPAFLRPEEIRSAREYCGLREDLDPLLEGVARRIAARPALSRLAWHAYFRLYHRTEGGFERWPGLSGALGDEGGAFYLLISLAMVPLVRAKHRELEVPEDVTRDTCLEVRCFCDNHETGHGRPGIMRGQLFWLRHYVSGTLFRLGRFEYMVRPFHGRLEAYRHRETRQVIALAQDGVGFDADGFIPRGDDPPEWTATLEHSEDAVVGHVISPRGYAVQHQMRLDTSEWECVLRPGDGTLDMHIPSGGNMTPRSCLDSMRRACGFFPRYFPERKHVAIACGSWIFNTQFEGWLGDDSNLVRFLRELYLFPITYGGRDGLFFVFCREDVDPATAPRDTALQRAMLDQIAAGKPLRASGMFTFEEDLVHYGTQHYRQYWTTITVLER